MDFWDRYDKTKRALEKKSVWVPPTKAVVVYSREATYIFWLGGETANVIKAKNISLYEATKYALKGILPGDCELEPADRSELIEQRELFAAALADVGSEIPEPYYSRFVGLALQIT